MPDMKKVIQAIENCIDKPKCRDCPWDDCEYEHEVINNVPYGLMRDALALLKEQPKIVRCVSCTFYRSDGECALHNGRWKPEGFCSWAIRKEGR